MSKRFSRQSFLGEAGQAAIEDCAICVAGLGGGGHIIQQFAHVGFLDDVIYDADTADESNLNRLVIAGEADSAAGVAVRATARVDAFQCRWQDRPEPIRCCDLVIGCVDSYAERQQLETCCRRYLIPYIDIGMDIHAAGDEPPTIGGLPRVGRRRKFSVRVVIVVQRNS